MDLDTPASISSVRATKRKLEDAIRSLDGAIVSSSLAATTERPTPSKRPHLTRSIYSTLAQFGVTSKERQQPSSKSFWCDKNGSPSTSPSSSAINVSKTAPRLTAILARAASKQTPPSNRTSVPPVHPASEYRPSSTDSFLSRLASYKITTYANKPPQINAVSATMCGWINSGKDRLVCGMCDVSWVLAGREGMNKDAASALAEKQRVSLVEMHKDGCPWKTRQCDPSVYRVPLQTPTAMVCELRATALALEPTLTNIAIKHPLTLSQLGSLRSIFSAAASERWSEHVSAIEAAQPMVPSDPAIVVALFGWVPAPAATRGELHYTASLSIPRTASYGPSASVPPTRSISRASSVSSRFREPASISSASPPRSIFQLNRNASPDRFGASSHIKTSYSGNITDAIPRDTSLVYCSLCQRRVGLWGFYMNNAATVAAPDEESAPMSRQHLKVFDLVKEHRSYCPYIVCSSVVPSFLHPPAEDSLGNVMEGWRAVMTVVQRYELSQRQQLSRFMPGDDLDGQPPSAELKGVEAMVAGVKTNGGRELLRYVKGLLG